MTSAPPRPHWARRADGAAVEIRPLGPDDGEAIARLHADLPAEDRYSRFFTLGGVNAQLYVRSLVHDPEHRRPAVGAFGGDRLLGVASYARTGPGTAEFAVAVAHGDQARGVGTLLVEDLAAVAESDGITTLVADVLAGNHRMLRLLADLGRPMLTERDDDVVHVTLRLDEADAHLAAVDHRSRIATSASLRPLLAPTSVAVVGASRRTTSVGHAILDAIRRGGFAGALTAVNPHARSVAGVPCAASVGDLAEPPDLAVVCVPAGAVLDVVRECAAAGVASAVIVTAGIPRSEVDEIRALARAGRMRVVGPNCLGVANTAVRLNATFMARAPRPGGVGLACQSGGVAIAVADALAAAGLGVSALVSLGDKADVSGNDLLEWWFDDDGTDAALFYLESFGDPRRFARLARALSRRQPVVAIRAGTSAAGSRAAGSHTAAAATPAATAEALYRQAGVTAVDSTADAVAALALFAGAPPLRGRRTAVITNAGGAGVLAADACVSAGLAVAELSEASRRSLAELLPATAALHNPVDTTAVVAPAVFAECAGVLLADAGVDAVVAITVPTALGDPGRDIARAGVAARAVGTPLLIVPLGQQAPVVVAEPPSYADPVRAVRALAAAADRADWLARPAVRAADPAGFDGAAITALLDDLPGGTWLDPADSAAVLAAAGIPVVTGQLARDAGAAVAAWRGAAGPVALKAVTGGLLHKSRAGGVLLDVDGEDRVRAGVAALVERFGPGLRGVFVQPMAPRGPELLVGLRDDPRFGPLLVFGAGGVDAEAIGGHAVRLCPLTEADIADLVAGSGIARAHPGIDAADLLRRVCLIAESVPGIAELDINPVTAGGPRGYRAIDARVRVADRRAP
ncbi:GNAT family N-acetyltransferase [Actinokineospora guangxiensis]|uniref:GNAT family N-acetyltransferase n=1 Tax=Actinokineospora guangxiensis TaxID=1490288 RepID=A0ABW0EKL9_9PSEU